MLKYCKMIQCQCKFEILLNDNCYGTGNSIYLTEKLITDNFINSRYL